MVVTEKEGDFIAATNFYVHDVPFEYEKQGLDRYELRRCVYLRGKIKNNDRKFCGRIFC